MLGNDPIQRLSPYFTRSTALPIQSLSRTTKTPSQQKSSLSQQTPHNFTHSSLTEYGDDVLQSPINDEETSPVRHSSGLIQNSAQTPVNQVASNSPLYSPSIQTPATYYTPSHESRISDRLPHVADNHLGSQLESSTVTTHTSISVNIHSPVSNKNKYSAPEYSKADTERKLTQLVEQAKQLQNDMTKLLSEQKAAKYQDAEFEDQNTDNINEDQNRNSDAYEYTNANKPLSNSPLDNVSSPTTNSHSDSVSSEECE